MEGYFLCTFARTFFFSAGEPNWLIRDKAFRAWALSSIGYLPPPKAKSPLGIFFRFSAVSLAISVPRYTISSTVPRILMASGIPLILKGGTPVYIFLLHILH